MSPGEETCSYKKILFYLFSLFCLFYPANIKQICNMKEGFVKYITGFEGKYWMGVVFVG